VGTNIKQAENQKIQLEEDLKQHQGDRAAAKTAIEEATALRKKEAAAFAKEKADLDANLAALGKAITAIEKGMTGGFLQTGAAVILRNLVSSRPDMLDGDRQEVMAFLSGSASSNSEYVPKSGEITGILKEIHDEMSRSLEDATNTETKAIQDFEELMDAKNKEVEALTKSIETKLERVGSLAVEIVQMKNDLTDTEAQLLEDQKFQADLEKSCGTKEQDWEERQKTRNDELVAIADTIKFLNDDDALDLFKKTLPSAASASASFVQVNAAARKQRDQALALLREATSRAGAEAGSQRPEFGFLASALEGKKVGLDKVIKMVDNLVATLKQEQIDDENKKEYCSKSLDMTDNKKQGLAREISDLETMIADAEEGISSLKDEMKTLAAGLKALDKEAAEQTEMRKAEHQEYSELMSSNSAAKEVLGMAKNRLNKFYNPKLYKPSDTQGVPALIQNSVNTDLLHADQHQKDGEKIMSKAKVMSKAELLAQSQERVAALESIKAIAEEGEAAMQKVDQDEEAVENSTAIILKEEAEWDERSKQLSNSSDAPALVQISAHSVDRKEAIPPPPETYSAYSKKHEESSGVIAMIDLLVRDLEKEMTEAETSEEIAQKQYTEMMQESAARRAADSKSLTQKQATMAALETDLESGKEKKTAKGKELMATMEYIKSLHAECDWLLQYFDVRKEARSGEIDALKKAKAVLNGADLTLLQKQLKPKA